MWLLLAASAAVCFGLRGIFYQWTSKLPADRNSILFGVYLCGALVALLANLFYGQTWTHGAWVGVFMGIFSFVSNSAMHKGFAVGKASLVAILVGLPPVFVVAGAYVLWGETLTWEQACAFVIIVCGIIMIRYSNDISLKNLRGVQWGVLAMITFAITDLASKQATLWGGETLPTLVLMYGSGSLLFGLNLLRSRNPNAQNRSEDRGTRLQWPFAKTIAVGMAGGLTNIFGMILMLPALRMGVTSLVSAVVALNVLLILLYARVVLKETFTRLEVAGISFAVCGVLALRLFA